MVFIPEKLVRFATFPGILIRKFGEKFLVRVLNIDAGNRSARNAISSYGVFLMNSFAAVGFVILAGILSYFSPIGMLLFLWLAFSSGMHALPVLEGTPHLVMRGLWLDAIYSVLLFMGTFS